MPVMYYSVETPVLSTRHAFLQGTSCTSHSRQNSVRKFFAMGMFRIRLHLFQPHQACSQGEISQMRSVSMTRPSLLFSGGDREISRGSTVLPLRDHMYSEKTNICGVQPSRTSSTQLHDRHPRAARIQALTRGCTSTTHLRWNSQAL